MWVGLTFDISEKKGLQLTFDSDSVHKKYRLVGEDVNLECKVEILGAKGTEGITNVTITHSTGTVLGTHNVQIGRNTYINRAIGKYEGLKKNGTELFYCHWRVIVEMGSFKADDTVVTNLTMRVYCTFFCFEFQASTLDNLLMM